MKSVLKVLGLAAILGVCAYGTAQASIFYWQDPASKLSVSFPDTWKVQSNQLSHDILTVQAPGNGHFATCRISAQEEGRFKIYPIEYEKNIQPVALNNHFWARTFSHTNEPVFYQIEDHKGLGRGFASMATLAYETAPDNQFEPKVFKRSIAFASLYGNTLYTVECSSEMSVYHQWHGPFLSFIKSIDFKKITNHNISGYYRNFLEDCILKIRGPRPSEDSYH